MRSIAELAKLAGLENVRPRGAPSIAIDPGAIAGIHRRLASVERESATPQSVPAPRKWRFDVYRDSNGLVDHVIAEAVG